MTIAKPNSRWFRDCSLAVLAGAILLFAPTVARAADPPKIDDATIFVDRLTGQSYITLSFDTDFKPEHQASILDSRNYRVARINFGRAGNDRFLSINKVTIDADEIASVGPNPPGGLGNVRVYLDGPVDLAPGDTLTLYYVGTSFAGIDLKKPVMGAVIVPPKGQEVAAVAHPGVTRPPATGTPTTGTPTGAATTAAVTPKRTAVASGFALKAAKGREDANIYFSGEIGRASGKDFNGTVDLKIEIPIVPSPRHIILPKLDLKASNNPQADPDTIKVGVEWQAIVAQAGLEYSASNPVSGIFWHNSGKIEGDRDFDNVNAMWSSQVLLRLKNRWFSQGQSDRAYALFTPYFGTEIGKNLESPVREAKGKGLARVLVGSYVYARLYQGSASFARFTMDGVYERRWPLRSEVGFRVITVNNPQGPDMKVAVPAFFGTKPRQWAEAKLNYNLTEYFALFTGYQYGELPPAYKLVDHSVRLGLVLKAKLK